MEGLFLFIICTLTFYFMYYFYQPRPTRPELDPRDRKPNKSKLQFADTDDHIKDSFSTLQSVSEAILKAGMSKASLVLGIT